MRIRTITAAGFVAAAAVLATAGTAQAAVLAKEDFSSGVGDWQGAVTTGVGGTLLATDSAYSYFGGIAATTEERTTPLGDGYIAELDVYLDPAAMSVGEGFDLSVATSNVADGIHLRDFIFHVAKDTSTSDLMVGGSNNSSNSTIREDLESINHYTVTDAGWYTLQHSFSDNDGVLAVDLNLLDSEGEVLWTETRSNAKDIATDVGGARYQWLTFVNGSFEFDNQSLERVEAKPVDQCGDNAWEAQGFKNQGQCIASLVANEKAGK